MHGFTNYQQSKALYERGYRHPKAILLTYIYTEYPAFSLADLVTMQGAMYHIPSDAPVSEIIQSYVDSCLEESDSLVELSNQKLREVYE
jgi:hypothetical protein